MKNADNTVVFGAHELDHVVGLIDSADMFMSESTGSSNIQAGPYSTIACAFCAGGCAGCISTLNPF